MMLSPRLRKGALGDQKGPRMTLDVGDKPCSVTILLAISSTRLQDVSGCFLFPRIKSDDLRFKSDHVADTVALIANGGADLADRVDKLHTEHPLGGSELDLTRKLVDVLDQRAQDHASTVGGVGAHGIHHVGREVGVEAGVGGHDGGESGLGDSGEGTVELEKGET